MANTFISVVSAPVSDQDRAKAFYVDQVGFEVVNDASMGDQRWVQVRPPGALTSITLVTWFPTMAPGSLKGVVLQTDDIEASVAALTARGVTFAGPIEDQPWGGFATFDDPDANGWVLAQM